MENSYAVLIEQERAKIALLKAKIVECGRRIQMLESMMNADDLDNILAKTVAHDVVSPQVETQRREEPHVQTSVLGFEMPKKKLSANVLALLNFIGSGVGGKTLDELELFSQARGLRLDRGAIRSFASNYRIKYGFLDSQRTAHFELTERGHEYLRTHGSGSNSETPSVGAEGVSDTSTETAGSRTESDGLL